MFAQAMLPAIFATVITAAPATGAEIDPYDHENGGRGSRHEPSCRPLHAGERARALPRSRTCRCKESVSQYGITWTFDKPAPRRPVRQRRLVCRRARDDQGDRLPSRSTAARSPTSELDHMDKERPEEPARPQRLHAQSARGDESRLRQRRPQLVRSLAHPEAARGDEARRFAGLDDQHAQGPGAARPVAEQDRARRGGQQPDPHRRRADLRGASRSRADAFRPAFCDRQAEDLSRPQPASATCSPGRGAQEHAGHRAVCPLHAAALGRDRLLRLRGAGGEHAAVRPRVRPRRRASPPCCSAPT